MSDSCLKDEVLNNKNKQDVHCQFCHSLVLKAQQGIYEVKQFDLPLIHQKNTKDINTIETESLEDFWVIDDMFTFENIGFSNTVDKRKFLICADCEMGPVGYHDIETKKCFVALKRVHHGNEKPQ
ncbi:guanine nucleotide exchange factor MSS4 homolog [Stomoxys calcitrans]|uniref:Guanine nucleotide exchange factor MSS4 homolog n=1 Tax=Stomoxys calcitrans TaxID=35570 RepID=A0A1I8Q6A7_STOCA|nr:guanine nucleotide exchange factor MSS4 homolog [Stomoxys calcitrans]XP_013105932.1 guanine nucleotide exchange factor MSS4 homolog [Stomoxys calcitrans]